MGLNKAFDVILVLLSVKHLTAVTAVISIMYNRQTQYKSLLPDNELPVLDFRVLKAT